MHNSVDNSFVIVKIIENMPLLRGHKDLPKLIFVDNSLVLFSVQ